MNETEKIVKSIYDNIEKDNLKNTSKNTIEKIVREIKRKGKDKIISDALPVIINFLNERNR